MRTWSLKQLVAPDSYLSKINLGGYAYPLGPFCDVRQA